MIPASTCFSRFPLCLSLLLVSALAREATAAPPSPKPDPAMPLITIVKGASRPVPPPPPTETLDTPEYREWLEQLETRLRSERDAATRFETLQSLPSGHPYRVATYDLANSDNQLRDKDGETMFDKVVNYLKGKLPDWLGGDDGRAPDVVPAQAASPGNSEKTGKKEDVTAEAKPKLKPFIQNEPKPGEGMKACNYQSATRGETGAKLEISEQCADSDGYMTVSTTEFGHLKNALGKWSLEPSAYPGRRIDPRECQCSLPFRFDKPRWLEIELNGKKIPCETLDVGPWNTNDPYWMDGNQCRPLVENQLAEAKKVLDRAGNRERGKAELRRMEKEFLANVNTRVADELRSFKYSPTRAKAGSKAAQAERAEQLKRAKRKAAKRITQELSHSRQPIAQNGRAPTQKAGLDLTPGCWEALGISANQAKYQRSSEKIRWKFHPTKN